MQVVRTEYWDYCPQRVLEQVFDGDFPGFDLEHAALIETSMMLHWHPEWVRQDRIPNDGPAAFRAFDHYPQDGEGVPASGVLAPATTASADKGRLVIDATLDALEAELSRYFA
jgi:creatinine amidohydrolase